MSTLNSLRKILIVFAAISSSAVMAALGPGGSTATASAYTASPPQVVVGADPFLMIDLSVELTQQAEGYTDAARALSTFTCGGRASTWNGSSLNGNGIGVCFKSSQPYLGYFDPNKCYTYNTGDGSTTWKQQPTGPYPANGLASSLNPPRFVPSRMADANRECGNAGEFSGNFLNWATMTALDEFRSAMTGGARLVDTSGSSAATYLVRTYRYASWPFVPKVISSASSASALAAKDAAGTTYVTNINKVTPWNVTSVRISNGNPSKYSGQDDSSWVPGQKVRFYDNNNNLLGEYDVTVDVCNQTVGVESNCQVYSDATNPSATWYKPEGILQGNSQKMRFALTSYTGRSGNAINGGVLRANAKYIGYYRPSTSGGSEVNPNAETDQNGLYVFDPDGLAKKFGVNSVKPVNSGILNYINQFALFAGQYKANDPDAELYYEGLRYLMNLGPTSSFWNPPTANGGALTAAEQDGYPIFGVGNAGSPAWTDPITNSCQNAFALYVGDQFPHRNDYLPDGYSLGSDDPACSTECTDATARGIDATSLENKLGGAGYENFFTAATDRGRHDGYGMSALAYWARTHDIHFRGAGAAPVTTSFSKSVKTYVVDTQEYNTSKPITGSTNGLWVAAKYGGFEDLNNNNDIDVSATPSEWDANGDGNPDNYTLASDPANLIAGLSASFSNLLQKNSTSSAAAVVANATRGIGAIYQALYEPKIAYGSNSIIWTGRVRGLFIDGAGNIREDTNSDGLLTNADYVVQFFQDPAQNYATFAKLLDPVTFAAAPNTAARPDSQHVQVQDLIPIWDGSDRLAALTDTQITTQRSYSNSAANGRYIFTWIDTNGNGVVDSGEVKDFTPTNFPNIDATNNNAVFDPARLLGFDSVTGANAGSLVDYIRGSEANDATLGWRSRTLTMPLVNNGNPRVYRLGDMVHSAPIVVGAPSSDYDVVYSDDTYQAFKQQYANRRQVVYVGANDGMLHAFNAGFFSSTANGFVTSLSGEVAHPLGSELWAYVPYNLLPHLQWLKDMQYPHVYYVDGAPQSFDVDIFPVDADHPYGWGTILVVGFRQGGGEITVNATTDQTGVSDPGNRTLRPAYVVFDVTNPEKAPVLLGEISDPSMGYTFSQPTVVKMRIKTNNTFTGVSPADTTQNRWYLLMGSGPWGDNAVNKQIAHDDAVSYQTAKVYAYDLQNKTLLAPFDTGLTNSFVGDLVAQDWQNDYTDEVAYFGTVGGTVANPTGALMRMQMPAGFDLGTPTFSQVLTGAGTDLPFSAPPLPLFGPGGQPWVVAGTGRFYVSHDVTATKQMSYFGVHEDPSSFASVDISSLVNTTGIKVFADQSVQDSSGNSPFTINSTSVSNYQQLKQVIAAASGWYFNLLNGPVVGAERNVDQTLNIRDTLLFVGYSVSDDTCNPAGSSALYGPNLLTGTAAPTAALGQSLTVHNGSGSPLSQLSIPSGQGQYFSSGLYQTQPGTGPGNANCPSGLVWVAADSGGGAGGKCVSLSATASGRMSWRELPLP